jgi:hypothetical protein
MPSSLTLFKRNYIMHPVKAIVIICLFFWGGFMEGSSNMNSDPKSNSSELAECTSIKDVKRFHGKKVLVKGWYEVEPIPGSKRLQAACVVLSDGTRLIRSYNPVKEEFGFINKQVILIGVVMGNSGQPASVQQVMAPHLTNIQSITLAPGETPYPAKPVKIPDLPFVETREDLKKWNNHWIHLFGRLTSITLRKDESIWADAQVDLQDGTRIILEWIPNSQWKAYRDKLTTITLRLNLDKEEKGIFYLSGGRTALCEGRTNRCGMD